MPAQLSPGRWLATGAGERLQALPGPRTPFGLLVLPLAETLSTAAVYQRTDQLGVPRAPAELARARARLAEALGGGAALPSRELLANDLQAAAISLCPAIEPILATARGLGAEHVLVSGSGPTVVALFDGPRGPRAGARRGARAGRPPAGRRLGGPGRGLLRVCGAPGCATISADRPMSRTHLTDLAIVAAGVIGLALYASLILVPAWNSYSRLWERLVASLLSLYVLAVLVGIGVAVALVIVYNWA